MRFAFFSVAHAPGEVLRPSAGPWPSPGLSRRWRRRLGRSALALALVAALVAVAGVVVERPLRRELERRVNASLEGYTATIGRVDLRVLGLGLDLHEVTVVQNGLPRPPVVYIPLWSTSVHWRALLSGALVADVSFTRPALYVTLAQAEQEVADPTPASEHGWQEAVTSIYPLKVNLLRVTDGSLFYWDRADPTPVHLRRVSLRAGNIRNVHTRAGRYPSPLEIDAVLADGARLRFDGRADFLAEPVATLRGSMELRDLTLKALAPALRAADVEAKAGRLGADGRLERTATETTLALARVTLDDAHVDYVQRRPASERQLDRAARAATTSEPHPATRVDVDEAVVRNATLGLVNHQTDPGYRLFLAGTDARIEHFSNQRGDRRGTATVSSRFMGDAPLRLDADFAPAATHADFRMDFRVEDAPLEKLNDVLRATAGLDVVGGRLSVYSQLQVAGGRVDGYVKPMFRDVDVYDAAQDERKGPLAQAYEAFVGAGSTVLENRPRDEVATVADLSGPIENPRAATTSSTGGGARLSTVPSPTALAVQPSGPRKSTSFRAARFTVSTSVGVFSISAQARAEIGAR
jgi:hypothetical protein